MNTEKLLAQLTHWKEVLVVVLFSWIPLSPGRILRNLVYRSILGRIGKSTKIETGVELINANSIELGYGVRIDRDVRLRNVRRNTKICLGDRACLGRGVNVKVHPGEGGKIEIGDRTSIGPYSCLSGLFIKIGKNCLIAPHVGIFANNHVYADPTQLIVEQGHSYEGIVIEDDCWLGYGAKVMDGVTISQGSVIGAGAVVTKDVPPYSVAVGVPAKVVSQREQTPKQAKHSRRLRFQRLSYSSVG
ncbi:acyltransferase [Oculatella sp. FACHB-28]|uniref:acyltransferase n=1 Tax=Oculatella sp. FACHB-28 TaxID=2692845 RepID=UPI0016899478|nr:acyltransferase [Oculatella sp. FACHB-28]MBD2059598.1 acyltransferase [Oculatella sp. FACHB-28]